ncbi:uncharacterized protein LOC134774149 [Penaeus indicus]|uniref:uncharacterized protein LOC134774149 n=1 Tax=Penaeus indicus TaxID=29960 RepID=UPI00300D57AC
MKKVIPTVLLAVVALSCLEGATSAAVSHPHRHAHQRGHVARLQETVDRLLLRQKTDHILLSTLQRAVLELQDKSQRQETPSAPEAAQTPSMVHEAVQIVEAEGRALAALGEQVAEVRGTLTEALKAEEKDDVTQLRQEIAYLRSEVQRLKATRAAEASPSAAHMHAHEQREAVAAAWVVENVRRLQDSVVELQQALNVSQAMHDKMEVESRLLTVAKDVGALRGSMAAVTSKAEAALATSEALQDEVGRLSEEAHRTAGHLGALATEVTSIRQDFNDLLEALPEGTMAGAPAAAAPGGERTPESKVSSAPQESEGGAAPQVTRAAHDRQAQRLAALERRADDFDFALTRAQKQWSAASPSTRCEDQLAELTETERQLQTRVEAVTSGVGEVRLSSVQLLAALEALEGRLEKEVSEVKQEVAKLEVSGAQWAADHKGNLDEARVALDDAAALRTDLEAVSRRLDRLTLKTAGLESGKLEGQVSRAECRTKHLALELRVSDAVERLRAVEEHVHHRPSRSAEGQPDDAS